MAALKVAIAKVGGGRALGGIQVLGARIAALVVCLRFSHLRPQGNQGRSLGAGVKLCVGERASDWPGGIGDFSHDEPSFDGESRRESVNQA